LKAEEDNLLAAKGLVVEIQALTEVGMLREAARMLPFTNDRITAALALSEGGITESLEILLSEEIASDLERLTVQITDNETRRDVAFARVLKLQADQEMQAEHESETRRIENEITVNETIYKDFVSQLSRRTEQDDYLDSDGRIIEFARPPPKASAPRRSQTGVVTFVFAFFIGIAIVLFREIYQNKLRTVYEIENTTGLTLLGFLPDVGKNVDLINNPDSPILLQFMRKLRVSLSSELPAPVVTTAAGNGPESVTTRAAIIAGTSASPSEGVSSSLFLLAKTFAQSGEKVLLLDCNFWNSAYTQIAHKPVESLAEIEARPDLVSNLIAPIAVPGLYVLPALIDKDSENSAHGISDFFNSRAFSVLIEHLSYSYDRIIIDTPPLLPIVDSVSILAHADLVLYFLQWNSTPAGAVESAMRILADTNANVEFCVATRVKLDKIAKYGDASLSFASKAVKKGY
jgi:Mrp family chromosome partitioning ATPase